MGWKWISMGWIARAAAWTHEKAPRISISNAKTRPSVAVRINTVPYSAQGSAGLRGRGGAGHPLHSPCEKKDGDEGCIPK